MNRIKKKVALFGHGSDLKHFDEYIHGLNSGTRKYSDALKAKIMEWTPSYVHKKFDTIISTKEVNVSAFHVITTFFPKMLTSGLKNAFKKIEQSFDAAIKEGVDIISLGGFTSIICIGKEKQLVDRYKVPVTSGNTLTAAIVINQIEQLSVLLDKPLENATVAIIGGSGDIGSGCALALSNRVKKIILSARGLNRLEKIAANLQYQSKSEIEITTNNNDAIRFADIIVSTASTEEATIMCDYIPSGAIVLDVSYPKSLSHSISKRNDIFAFIGGVAKMPVSMDFGYSIGLPSVEILYGCYAEGLVLALEGIKEIFSHGRGNITVEKMDFIYSAAQKHGINAALYSISQCNLIDKDDLFKIKEKVSWN